MESLNCIFKLLCKNEYMVTTYAVAFTKIQKRLAGSNQRPVQSNILHLTLARKMLPGVPPAGNKGKSQSSLPELAFRYTEVLLSCQSK